MSLYSRYFIQSLIFGLSIFFISGCSEEITDPNEPFVGGKENAASDGTYTSKIYSENGIASLEEITLGGEKQWILIRGYDVSNPVLIFLHGGPGSACIFYTKYSLGGLEEDFTTVGWDQRGSGKSYHESIDPNTLTLDQLYGDTYELILKMRERFGIDKVYLMGISWGSILGIKIAKQYPEVLHSYIGVSQVVNTARGIVITYNKVLDEANERGNQAAITELSGIHLDSIWEHSEIISKWVEEFGFGDFHNDLIAQQIRVDLASTLTEYTPEDIANLDKGKLLYNQSPLGNDLSWLRNIDMPSQIPSLEIPVYFLAGSFDYKTPSQLVDEYFQSLVSPAGKKLIWFENSAHIPILEEREIFQDTMINTVLEESL